MFPNLNVFSVDPGFTHTNIHSSQLDWFRSLLVWVAGPALGAWPASIPARTLVWLAGGGPAGEETGRSGSHWYDCRISDKVDEQAEDQTLREDVWQKSEHIVGRALEEHS